MSDIVIRVENLGKKYSIGHQKRERYTALRDVLADKAKSFKGQILTPFGNKISASKVEEFWALKDVSFEIKQGDRVGIIGRNGAGKSTLLKVLSRITEPTKGSIRIKGRVASLLEVGTGFHPELTGRENIYLNGAILGMSKGEIKQKFDEIVDFAGVEKFLETPVKRYSSGMYVRLAFAVAAHLEPEILIVDEVLAVGDVQFQKKCLDKMKEVGQEGRTVLFVSHNMGVLQSLCTRGILLKQGTVFCDDTASASISTYLRTIEESASQSLLERTERRGKGEVRLTRIDICAGRDLVSTNLAVGCPANFVFHTNTIRPNMSCIFTIYDQYGQAVTNFNSAIQSQEDLFDPKIGTKFLCELDELVLAPGRYRMNVAIFSDGELQDHVEGAESFEVEAGQLRGRPIRHSSWGSVCLQHHWVIPVTQS